MFSSIPVNPFSGTGRKWETFLKTGALFVALVFWGAAASAQDVVTGEVTDAEEGGPLPGVNVVVKGTTTGTATNSSGEYSLEVPSSADSLVFSFVGYEPQTVSIGDREQVNVELGRAVTGLQEVVVEVGYGQQTVATTTGSVSQISGEDLEVKPVNNLTNSLSGTVPGIIGVNTSGQPGDDGSGLLIRGSATLGNNSPLVVIDGVPAREGGLARLNPSDIKSLTVLKDASAAIYGSRAANGVILVKTKRGQEGAPEVNFNVSQGISQPTVLPDMADAPTYLTMLNELEGYRGNPPRYSQEQIEAHRSGTEDSWQYYNTDWYAETFKQFSRQTRATASVNGGGNNLRYYLSLRGLTENGIIKNSATRYNQIGFRSNIDGDIDKNITLHLNLHGRLEDRNYPTVGEGSIFWMLQRGKPHEPAYWPNGKPGPDIEYGQNPVVAATPETGYDNDERYYFQSNLGIDATVPGIEGLTLKGDVSYDQRFQHRKVWRTPWTLYYWDYQSMDAEGNPDLTPTQVGHSEPQLSQSAETERDLLARGTANYEKSLGSHNFALLLGTEVQTSNNTWMSAFRRYYATDQIDQLFAGGEAERNNNGSGSHSARLNYFTRVNYDYQQKYLFEFVGRYDGSYIFPKGKRFGFFPGFSAGWRISQEDWFSDAVGLFDELKLRASWGQTGNDQIEPYQYLRTYRFGGGYVLGGAVGNSITQARVPNPNITWEVANQLDMGVQGTMLDNRLAFEVAYYDYMRTDILWWRGASIPQTAGFSLPRENIGKVASSGVDGNVSYSEEVSSDLSFTVGANFSYASNEIKYWAESPGAPEYQRSTGAPMRTDLYYVADGVFNDQAEVDNNPHWPGARPGDIKFKDINGDGEINGLDRKRIKENGTPDLIGGLNLSAKYRQFRASMQLQGVAQARQYVFGTHGEFGNYFQQFADRRWSPETPDQEHPRAFNRRDPYWAANGNTYFLRDAKYLRVENVRVSYSLPSGMSNAYGFGNVQLYVSGNNLMTFSPMKIMDPESRSSGANYYPQMRTFNAGLQLNF